MSASAAAAPDPKRPITRTVTMNLLARDDDGAAGTGKVLVSLDPRAREVARQMTPEAFMKHVHDSCLETMRAHWAKIVND